MPKKVDCGTRCYKMDLAGVDGEQKPPNPVLLSSPDESWRCAVGVIVVMAAQHGKTVRVEMKLSPLVNQKRLGQ